MAVSLPSEGAPIGAPGLELAAAAVVIAAAAVIIIVTAAQAVIAATAEQEQQDDDPAPVTTAETIVIHNEYLPNFVADDAAHSKIFRGGKKVQRQK